MPARVKARREEERPAATWRAGEPALPVPVPGRPRRGPRPCARTVGILMVLALVFAGRACRAGVPTPAAGFGGDGRPRPTMAGYSEAETTFLETAAPSELLSFFNYTTPRTFSVGLLETRKHFLLYSVTWESAVRTAYPQDNQVSAFYYQPRASGKVPAIAMLHSYGTITAPNERQLCGYLADRGIACILPFLPYQGTRTPRGYESGALMISGDLDLTLQALRQAVVDIRSAVDWLQARPEVDPHRIGVVGVSLGAIMANLAMGIDDRLSVGVSVLGGGRVADIVWSSPIMTKVRAQLDARGITLAELRQRLRVGDPLTYASRNRHGGRALQPAGGAPPATPRRVLMIAGLYDVVVPPQDAEALWRALGKPRIIWLPTGHYGPMLVKSELFAVVSDYLLEGFGEAWSGGRALQPAGGAPPATSAWRTGTGGRALQPAAPQIAAPTIKVGLLLDEDAGVSAAVGFTLVRLGRRGFLDLALTTEGPLIGLSRKVGQFAEVGLEVRLGEGSARPRPYLAYTFVL